MSLDEPDIGEAVDYILAERPRLAEDEVWAVLVEIGSPPTADGDALAIELVLRTHPDIRERDVKIILREWRSYASLAVEEDWGE